MGPNHRKNLREYMAKIEKVADEAERLHDSLEDESYRSHLKAEVQGYRDLIALWRERLERKR